jgi:predicted RNase H-like HicB family nuclease
MKNSEEHYNLEKKGGTSSEEQPVDRIHVKPLPDILDKMDANIRVAAEAARRAEEAAKKAESALMSVEKSAQDAKSAGAEASGKRYLVIFEKANDNYSAYSPDIPGCIATGKTRGEVEKNIKEAISLHFAGLEEDGLPIPEPASSIEYIEV